MKEIDRVVTARSDHIAAVSKEDGSPGSAPCLPSQAVARGGA